MNQLSTSLLGTKLLPYHHAPTEYNVGEFFGVEYLYRQAGREFTYTISDEEMLADNMDEGFVDDSATSPSMSEHVMTVGAGALGKEEEEDEEQDEENEDEVCMILHVCTYHLTLSLQAADSTIASSSHVTGGTSATTNDDITPDPRGIPGWDKVGQLAEELVGLTGLAVSVAQAQRIKALCDALDDFDKRAIEVNLRSQQPRLRGRFCSRKQSGHTTVEQMRRYVFSTNIIYFEVLVTGAFSLGSPFH